MKTATLSLYQAAVLLPLALVRAQSSSTTATGSASATSGAAGVVQTVQVGENGLVFEPESFTANPGDVISFVIHTSHNVARSSFGSPCVPIGGDQNIWSGDDLDDGTIFSVTVNDTNPIWLYCATNGHCQNGMAMVINPASSSSEDLPAYKAAALNVSGSREPDAVAGGVYGTPSSGDTSSSTRTSASATTSTSSGAGSSTTTSRPTSGATSTTASPTTTTPNAAPTMLADWKMIGGVLLGGAAMVL